MRCWAANRREVGPVRAQQYERYSRSSMTEPPNIALVRRLYESKMAPEVTKEVIAPDLIWDITPGFPNSGVYHGWDDVAQNFFGPIMPNYESFGAVPEEYFGDDDNHVFVFGHYHAETRSGNTAN